MANVPVRRCAIYTRKSSEEGLEQEYNSLHAQRDACEAFIKSQGGEGWRLIKTAYDDGGFSGGSMERPAMQQLLTHIRQGLIDVVVVYKVDRLTRSLADFARIIELFDSHNVSFVAVTQQFNTTTSMGRLTLNVLLSFAQFEREVAGERIRDKLAASKRKGIWSGGTVPLGYEMRGRRLVINPEEAQIVRRIFKRYLELGTVRKLTRDLAARGFVSAIRVSKTGNRRGGNTFVRGALYHLLSNHTYIGEIRHKDNCYPARHEALISRDLWDRVQAQLRSQAVRKSKTDQTEVMKSPLTGKIFDEKGEPLYVKGGAKGQRRYRYYVSKALAKAISESADNGWRLPVPEIEQTVAAAAIDMLKDRDAIIAATEESDLHQDRLPLVLKSAQTSLERMHSAKESGSVLTELVERVEVSGTAIRLSLGVRLPPVSAAEGKQDRFSFSKTFPMRLKRRGLETRMVLGGETGPDRRDPALIRAVARARRWAQLLISGQIPSISAIARREGIGPRYVRDVMPLAFLAPKIVEAIAEGRQPAELTILGLARRIEIPLLWSAQHRALGFDDATRGRP